MRTLLVIHKVSALYSFQCVVYAHVEYVLFHTSFIPKFYFALFSLVSTAAGNGHIKCLQWLLDNAADGELSDTTVAHLKLSICCE